MFFMLSLSYKGIWLVVCLFNVVFFVVLLKHLICVSAIQIMIVNKLKNWNRRYFNHYIIKFISYMLIYYVINLDII